jgi:putative redox protein
MHMNALDAAAAGKSVLITETGMDPLQLLGRVGSTSFVIAGSRRHFFPESLNPYELLGAALGACTAMSLRLYADQMDWPLSRIQVSVSHHSRGRDSKALFERTIILEGPLNASQRQRLLEVARQGPVDQTLGGGAEIHTFVSTDNRVSASPATSDYLEDIHDAVAPQPRGPAGNGRTDEGLPRPTVGK